MRLTEIQELIEKVKELNNIPLKLQYDMLHTLSKVEALQQEMEQVKVDRSTIEQLWQQEVKENVELPQRLKSLQGNAVLVVGEMPESCEECKLKHFNEYSHKYVCDFTGKRIHKKNIHRKRRDDCPLRVMGGGT